MSNESDAQAQHGLACLTRGDFAGALRFLESAADAGTVVARNALGLMHLNGLGCPRDVQRGAELIRTAADAALPDAQYNLAGLMLSGIGLAADADAGLRALHTAATQGFPPALRTLGLISSFQTASGQSLAAATCWHAASELGDAHSCYLLASLLLSGDLGFVDVSTAQSLFKRAEVAGIAAAGPRRAAAAQAAAAAPSGRLSSLVFPPQTLPMPNSARLFSSPNPTHEKGDVMVCDGVLSPLICEYIINIAAPRMRASEVVDPATGRGIRSEVRTNRAMNFQPSMHDPLIGVLRTRLATLTGSRPERGEPLAVLHYELGQEYQPHFDFFRHLEASPHPADVMSPGQRQLTCLCYLNTPVAGGATGFPRLGLQVPAMLGRVVAFRNCDSSGQPDEQSLHAGMPVTSGEKWVATQWFQEGLYPW